MYKYILVLAFAFEYTKSEQLFEPCNVNDLDCLRKATETFLSKTYGGLPALDIKKIDPLIIPSLHISVDQDMGIALNFENVNVTGLKELKIEDFEMDLAKHSVLLKMKADIVVNSDIKILLTKNSKLFKGDYSATASAIGTSNYSTTLETVNGTDYFVVGPEITTCEIAEDPVVKLGVELQTALDKDADAVRLKPEWEGKQVTLRKKFMCEIANVAFKAIVHNLRTSARQLPKNAFFKDI